MKNFIYASVILLIFLVILSTPAVAQEKQSDATWEETIGFINKNLNYLTLWDYRHEHDNYNHFTKLNYMGSIPKANLSHLVSRNSTSLEIMYTVPLRYLSKAEELSNKKLLILKLTGDYNKRVFKTSGKTEEPIYDSTALYYISDSEMRPRLLKAFQHLAYLATEHREKQRKAAGDAF